MSDNGGEFYADFRRNAEALGSRLHYTAVEAPWQNGQCANESEESGS